MQKPPLDPDVADTAPSMPELTPCDQEHLVTYLRLLDAEAEGAVTSRASSCIGTRKANRIAPGGRSKAIYAARNG